MNTFNAPVSDMLFVQQELAGREQISRLAGRLYKEIARLLFKATTVHRERHRLAPNDIQWPGVPMPISSVSRIGNST